MSIELDLLSSLLEALDTFEDAKHATDSACRVANAASAPVLQTAGNAVHVATTAESHARHEYQYALMAAREM